MEHTPLTTDEKIIDLFSASTKNTKVILNDIEKKYKIHIAESTISGIKNNIKDKRTYNTDTIIGIAKYFNVSTDYLLGLSDVPTSDKDLQFICDYTGLSKEALEYISDKNTNYSFKVFIEFIIDYAKKHKGFVNNLSFLRKSAVVYHSEIEFQNVLSNYYEQGNLNDETKKELCMLYKGNKNILPTKTQLFLLTSLKSDYNSTKYEISENIRDIVNEYSTSKIVNEETRDYFPYSVFTDDETKMLNSDYIEYLKSEIKGGNNNE